jgi:uroporphyrin-III C-methyltransferase/precorrin-2 dehydrogenase/sirohydrochlorin ferrochelatase
MRHPDCLPAQSDYDRLLADTTAGSPTAEPGSVTLIGAGPGDPELLTLRAVRAMQSADLIMFDRRVSPEILEFARREAKKMLVAGAQDEIDGLLIDLAKSGHRVVRLMGCGSSFEGELAACRKAGVPVEVVPGVATAPAATITPLGDGRPAASSA